MQKTDRRVVRTLDNIKGTLIELIEQKGFDSVSVKDITEKSNINRSTFYAYYQDKFDLLNQLMNEIILELGKEMSPLLTKNLPPFKEQVVVSFIGFFKHVRRHITFYKVMLGKNGTLEFNNRIFQIMREIFHNEVENINYSPNELLVPKDILVHYLISAEIGVLKWWIEQEMPYSEEYMANQIAKISEIGVLKAAGFSIDG